MITINKGDLDNLYNLAKFNSVCYNNGGSIYISKNNENIGLKVCKYIPSEKLEFFQNLNLKNGITFPKELYKVIIENIEYASYLMDYYKYAITLKDAINKNIIISEQEKKDIIKKYFETILPFHYYLVFGDIHLDNLLLIPNKTSYNTLICDWDNYRCLNEKKFIISPYYVGNYYKQQNRYSDIVKLVISSLSFYLNEDYEKRLIQNPLGFIELFNKISRIYPELEPSLDYLKTEFYNQKTTTYFNYEKFIDSLPTTNEIILKKSLYNPFF